MSLATRVLLGLGLGLAGGTAASASGNETVLAAVEWIAPLGTIWINALRMTIVPLVFAGIVVGAAASRDARSLGKLGGRTIVLFLLLLGAAAVFTVIVAPPLMDGLPIDAEAAARLRASATAAGTAAAATGFPDIREWLVALVPSNAIQAAADGAILPLIVFALAFGLAVARIDPDKRRVLFDGFRGLFDAMLVLIRWILDLAPIGVFALALPLATRLGAAAAGAVVYYIIVVCGLALLLTLALYPIAAVLGGVSLRQFARGAAAAQSIAFSGRSSLASLPAMIEGGRDHLGFPPVITNFFLPLAASTFRVGGVVGILAGVLFVARLYGFDLGPTQLATIALTTALITFSIPGVPGGSILIMAPVLHSVGVPAEGIGILLGVDTIPDMFRTMTNVTGDMAVATVLTRRERQESTGEGRLGQLAAGPPG